MQNREQREKLAVLLSATSARSTFRPRSIATQPVHPVNRRDILFIDGWAASKAKGSLNFDYLLVDEEWFELLHALRYARPDVSAHLNLESDVDLGFKMFVQQNNKLKNIFQKFASELYHVPIGNKCDLANVRLPIRDSDATGYVDAIQWLRYFQMGELDADRDYSIHVETSAPSQTAIMWLPGTLEFGERVSATRTRFSRPDGLITANAPRLLLPSDGRSDITVSLDS